MNVIGAIGEVVIHSGPASVWRSIEPVAGTLTLTTRHLRFRPHALLVQGGDISIPLDSIRDVEGKSLLGVIPNQLVVRTRGGKQHKFVVSNRDEWVEKIRAV